jgi:signal transduction histidine kinase
MRLSFKLKIAFLSLALSGTLLTAFGVLFFSFAYHAGIERMDQEMRTLVESSFRGPRPPDYWENFDKSLNFIYGEQTTARVELYVVDVEAYEPFISENAPARLSEFVGDPTFVSAGQGRVADSDGKNFSASLDQNQDGRISIEEFNGPADDFFYLDSDQDRFLSSAELSRVNRLAPPPRQRPIEPPGLLEASFQNLETEHGNWRVARFESPELVVIMAMDLEVFYQDIKGFQSAFLIAVAIGLLLLAGAGWFLAGRAMRPVARIADTAEGITAQGLDQRIPMVSSDIELERLVNVCNDMLDRLEKSYRQAVRFSADAAHELQTPLTILQGELDNAIQSADAGSLEQQRYCMLLEELSNLKTVVQKLLLLAHADEGRLKLNLVPVDLVQLLRTAMEDFEIIAPDLKIESQLPKRLVLPADAALLGQAIRNMTSNAAKYTEAGGHVRFSLDVVDGVAQCILGNSAEPISETDCDQLFERFYRVEKSRTTAGSGLGLSLAREIARAHHGDLQLLPYHSGMVFFALTLPLE